MHFTNQTNLPFKRDVTCHRSHCEVTVVDAEMRTCIIKAHQDTQHTQHGAKINYHPTRFHHMRQKSDKSSLAHVQVFLNSAENQQKQHNHLYY